MRDFKYLDQLDFLVAPLALGRGLIYLYWEKLRKSGYFVIISVIHND